MSAGSHPAISASRVPEPVAALIDRLRTMAATSAIWRSILLGTLGLTVTVAGVAAGALVVAPVVAAVSAVGDGEALGTTVKSATVDAAQLAWRSLEGTTNRVLAGLPKPVARYALPTLAVLSITGALLALFLPPRAAASRLGAVSYSLPAPKRTLSRLTPLGSARVSAKKQRTPRAVEAMAASGASTTDIAWKTGLPIDAVNLLLAISSGPRQLQPPTA
ncbi:MAG: hypothetical protein IT353_22955 [Gemmatimonadaceae bacterium]|nr:hypothetical protein [Gemmatimonadaceae bacterium]